MRIARLTAALVLALAGGSVVAQEAVPAGSASAANPSAPAPASPAAMPQQSAGSVVPPVKDRDTDEMATEKIRVDGFNVTGVGQHADLDVTPASIQALADKEYQQLAAEAGSPASLSLEQMQGVADKITDRYRKAGFIVSSAFLPAQTIGTDRRVEIHVLEGQIGKIIVKGNQRYHTDVIARPAEKLRGKPLLKSDVDTALLYARDIPGVAVSSTFQPGEKTGDTDLVMIAHEPKHPYVFTLGASNYGTDLTGKYRALAGMEWDNPFGIGDVFNANLEYAMDPNDNIYGVVVYRAPVPLALGMTAVAGVSRSELSINTGTFTALDVSGPTSQFFTGLDWKFVNEEDLKANTTLHLIREQSKLDSNGIHLSDERFTVLEGTADMMRTDRRFHGVDILQFGLRQALADDSYEPDLVSPNHDSNFLVAKLSYTRLQFLTKSQRLNFKFIGQYTKDALIPLEQLAMGGPDTVRSYPIADVLRDLGYYASLEYHVDAPGFGDVVSPFYARPWRELLEFEVFVDYSRGYSAGANRILDPGVAELSGAGAGLIFRLPRFKHFEFHLDGAKQLSSRNASDGKGYHIYSRFSFTF